MSSTYVPKKYWWIKRWTNKLLSQNENSNCPYRRFAITVASLESQLQQAPKNKRLNRYDASDKTLKTNRV